MGNRSLIRGREGIGVRNEACATSNPLDTNRHEPGSWASHENHIVIAQAGLSVTGSIARDLRRGFGSLPDAHTIKQGVAEMIGQF